MSRSNSYRKFFAVLIILALILMVGALMSATAYADDTEEPNPNGININAGLFPDEQLLSIVSSSKIDRDQNGFLSDYEISWVTTLQIPSCYTLEGIGYLSSLQSLTVNNFRGGSNEIDLSNNNALTYLSIGKASNLYSLDVSSNTALISLNLKDMPINELDLSKNAELTYLYLENCEELPELDLYNNTKLEELKLESSIIEKLDLRMNENLKKLSVTDALVPSSATGAIPLKELDVSGCSSLETITISNSNVDWLNLNGCVNLKRVSAAHCKIQCIYAVGIDTLEYFDGGFNENMKEAYFTGCSSLTDLTLNGVALEKLDLTGCSSLRIFHASGLQIETLDLTDCTDLFQLYIYGNFSHIDISNCKSLWDLYVNCPHLAELEVGDKPELESIDIDNQNHEMISIGALDLSGCPKLQSLNCYNVSVTNLDISTCSELRALRIYGDDVIELKEIDISNCPYLCNCFKNGTNPYGDSINNTVCYYDYYDSEAYESTSLFFDRLIKLIYDEGEYLAGKRSLDGAEVELNNYEYSYDGKAKEPRETVSIDGEYVSSDFYDVTYTNNVEPGTATVTVTGKDYFEGTATATFKIKKLPQTITVPKKEYILGYSTSTFKLGVTTNGDGTIIYKSSDPKVATVSSTGKVTLKGLGYTFISVYAKEGARYEESKKSSIMVQVTYGTNPLKVSGKTVTVKYSDLKTKNKTFIVSKVINFTNKGKGTLIYTKSSGNSKITIAKKTGKVTIKKGLKKGTYKVKIKVKAAGTGLYNAVTKTVTVTFKVK